MGERINRVWGVVQLVILAGLIVPRAESRFDQCSLPKQRFNPELEVQRFGKPTAFVATRSIRFSPYSLIDPYRQSALYHEYLLVGPGIANYDSRFLEEGEEQEREEEEIQLIVYDEEALHSWEFDPSLVQQNLDKEYLWALINATGMLPSMTVVNTSLEQTFRFHTDEGNEIAYHMAYPRHLRSQSTLPPVDVIIEFPAKTRMFQTLKTLIDYQTFGLLRWRLSPGDPHTWQKNLEWFVTVRDDSWCALPPDDDSYFRDTVYMQCIYAKRFKLLQNPCIKDMPIYYAFWAVKGDDTVGESSYFSVNRLRMVIPMVFDILDYRGFLDLTYAYCPDPTITEECGNPLDIVLTNDHLVILTEQGLWVSNSLNVSTVNVSFPYSMKPLLKFTPIDPCAQFNNFNCSEIRTPMLARQTIRRQRLFYTPICHMYQLPDYEDMLIYVAEHVTQDDSLSREVDVVSVLYSVMPYNDWKILFHSKSQYFFGVDESNPQDISEVLGIFYNSHRRQFDVSLLLKEPKTGRNRRVRFVIPRPDKPDFEGYAQLSGGLGQGFLEFEFPATFHMTHLKVNPEAMDIFFLGNQIWIAEAANAFPYVAILHVSDQYGVPSVVSECSFNHPDRTFVCVEKTHTVIYPGRVGISYSSASVVFALANELRFTMLHNLWPFKYRQYITVLGDFVMGYSGKIYLWFLYHPYDLVYAQNLLVNQMNKTGEYCDKQVGNKEQPVRCHVCKGLTARVLKHGCQLTVPPDAEIAFRMVSIDASKLKARNSITDGPLVPFLIDGDKVVFFEASIPDLDNYKPHRGYLTDVDVGYRIFCDASAQATWPNVVPPTGRKRRSVSRWYDQNSWEEEDENENYGRVERQASSGSPDPYNVTCPSMVEEEVKPGCELYLRHTKSLLRNGKEAFLTGFRRALYATIIKAFKLRPVPVDMVILVQPNSNDVLIQLDKSMFELGQHYRFMYSDVGQTLYLPEYFSVFLTGFPKFDCPLGPNSTLLHDMTLMAGRATRYYRQGIRIQLRPFKAYFIDFSTPTYCEWYKKTLRNLNFTVCSEEPNPSDVISQAYRDRREQMNQKRNEQHSKRSNLSQSLSTYYQETFASSGTAKAKLLDTLSPLVPSTYQQVEDSLLKVPEPAVGRFQHSFFTFNRTFNGSLSSPQYHATQNDTECYSPWKIVDGGCHLRLYLTKNPLIKQNGGRITLDKYDSISYQVKLRPLTPLGKSLIHRPLIGVSNTNPKVLTVDTEEVIRSDIQFMNLTLTPTGFGTGLASVTIRPLIISSACLFADGSFTLIISVRKSRGRRLHVNYPVPVCKPSASVGEWEYERPWKVDLPNCVTRWELLNKKVITRPDNSESSQVFYSELPVNYRPPSPRGSDIPLNPYYYNADPSKPRYKEHYRISQETARYKKCHLGKSRDFCYCSENDELSDDVKFSECKRMVYTAKRGFRVDISVEYDRIMRDADQHSHFFTPKKNWSVYLEEVNNRVEYTLSSATNPYLELVNRETHLNQGRKFYDAKTLGVTMHGTGLYHFQVFLGHFESFDEVSGYFMIMIPDDQLNHVQLVVIMLLTITVCMVFVFCGFLAVRRRLSSQLPFQTHAHDKIKLE